MVNTCLINSAASTAPTTPKPAPTPKTATTPKRVRWDELELPAGGGTPARALNSALKKKPRYHAEPSTPEAPATAAAPATSPGDSPDARPAMFETGAAPGWVKQRADAIQRPDPKNPSMTVNFAPPPGGCF